NIAVSISNDNDIAIPLVFTNLSIYTYPFYIMIVDRTMYIWISPEDSGYSIVSAGCCQYTNQNI
ncbi:MAG: hypothetical protein MK028_04730, partial [Dehalococcoidia bacterium]|nr:hypothetical protein [Dehalococcoidia bacterium]